jgi:hypothetical protein
MQHKNLLEVLAHGGLTRDGDVFNVPHGLSVTVYLDLADQTLCVDRVSKVEVNAELATITTARKERYAVELDQVTAVRFQPEGNAAGYA